MVYIEGHMATSVQNAQTVVSVLEEATKQSCQKALSLSDPWVAAIFKETIDQWIQYGIDILFCNDAEAMAFTQTSDLEQAQSILKTLTKQYVITCGAKGALLYDKALFESTRSISLVVIPMEQVICLQAHFCMPY